MSCVPVVVCTAIDPPAASPRTMLRRSNVRFSLDQADIDRLHEARSEKRREVIGESHERVSCMHPVKK